MDKQPVITVIAITASVTATVKMLVSFGLDITPEQTNSVNDWLMTIWPIATAAWLWFKVYAPATVARIKKGEIDG